MFLCFLLNNVHTLPSHFYCKTLFAVTTFPGKHGTTALVETVSAVRGQEFIQNG